VKTSRKVAKEPEFQAPPALTTAGREARCVAYAMDLVEERLLNKTASSQETVFFLKLGLQERQLELERLRNENELIKAKAENIQTGKELKQLYADALVAMSRYRPSSDDEG
jgi:hypothetical protein